MSNFKRTNHPDFSYINMGMVSSIKIMKFNKYEGIDGKPVGCAAGVKLTMSNMKTEIFLPFDSIEEAELIALSLVEVTT